MTMAAETAAGWRGRPTVATNRTSGSSLRNRRAGPQERASRRTTPATSTTARRRRRQPEDVRERPGDGVDRGRSGVVGRRAPSEMVASPASRGRDEPCHRVPSAPSRLRCNATRSRRPSARARPQVAACSAAGVRSRARLARSACPPSPLPVVRSRRGPRRQPGLRRRRRRVRPRPGGPAGDHLASSGPRAPARPRRSGSSPGPSSTRARCGCWARTRGGSIAAPASASATCPSSSRCIPLRRTRTSTSSRACTGCCFAGGSEVREAAARGLWTAQPSRRAPVGRDAAAARARVRPRPRADPAAARRAAGSTRSCARRSGPS